LCIIAGDETGDTDFIAFGRIAQQLTKKTADTLLASNLPGFIPNAITKLLERTYIWNVSFTDSTIESGTITLQVNSIVAAIDDVSYYTSDTDRITIFFFHAFKGRKPQHAKHSWDKQAIIATCCF
jgi:hypothetical protein